MRESYQSFDKKFRQTIAEYRPDVFVTFGDDGLFEAGMLHICRQSKVPSVFVQHGYIPLQSDSPKRYYKLPDTLKFIRRVLRKIRNGAKKIIAKGSLDKVTGIDMPAVRPFGLNGANMIAAINARDARYFVKHGVDCDQVVVTGHVLMDRLWRFTKLRQNDSSAFVSTSGRETPVRLLVISSGAARFGQWQQHRWFVDQIRNLVERENSCQLRVSLRLKPGEGIEDWRNEWCAVDKAVVVLSSSADLYPQIASADVIVAMNSQALMEALMIGKPVINLAPAGVKDPFRLVERGVVYCANSSDDLARILQNRSTLHLDQKQIHNRDVCYEEFFYRFDGQAGARAGEVIRRASSLS